LFKLSPISSDLFHPLQIGTGSLPHGAACLSKK
jgi:hypothetical protein